LAGGRVCSELLLRTRRTISLPPPPGPHVRILSIRCTCTVLRRRLGPRVPEPTILGLRPDAGACSAVSLSGGRWCGRPIPYFSGQSGVSEKSVLLWTLFFVLWWSSPLVAASDSGPFAVPSGRDPNVRWCSDGSGRDESAAAPAAAAQAQATGCAAAAAAAAGGGGGGNGANPPPPPSPAPSLPPGRGGGGRPH